MIQVRCWDNVQLVKYQTTATNGCRVWDTSCKLKLAQMVSVNWHLYCTVQGLKYAPGASIIGCRFQELIGCLSMTFGRVPSSNVADSLTVPIWDRQMFITVCNEVAKVMFLHMSVLLSTGGSASVHAGIPPTRPQSRHPPEQVPPEQAYPPEQTYPPSKHTPQQMATAVDGTHPTGMHSSWY